MNLWDLYAKFEAAKSWLATTGADTIEDVISANERLLEAARDLRDWLRKLDGPNAMTASLSVEDTQALEKFKSLKVEIDALVKPTEAVGVRAIPPAFKDLLLIALSKLIEKLLDKWK